MSSGCINILYKVCPSISSGRNHLLHSVSCNIFRMIYSSFIQGVFQNVPGVFISYAVYFSISSGSIHLLYSVPFNIFRMYSFLTQCALQYLPDVFISNRVCPSTSSGRLHLLPSISSERNHLLHSVSLNIIRMYSSAIERALHIFRMFSSLT